jgi:WD40 repeat protein
LNTNLYINRSNGEENVLQTSLPGLAAIDAGVSFDGAVAACITPRRQVRGWVRSEQGFTPFAYTIAGASDILRFRLSPSGERICLCFGDGTISIHAAQTGVTEGPTLRLEHPALAVAWSDDSQLLVIADATGKIEIYDSTTLQVVWSRHERQYGSMLPTALGISPDQQLIAIAVNETNALHVIETRSDGSPRKLIGHDGIIRELQFSPDSSRIYTGSYDGTLREWSCTTGQQIRIVD